MSINYEVSGNVATITLDRPQAHNAMDTAAYREITERLRELDSDPDVRVGIVTGAGGRAFSAGADLKEMHGDGEQLDPWAPWQPDRWDLGVTIAKPLIAAIDGYATCVSRPHAPNSVAPRSSGTSCTALARFAFRLWWGSPTP
jgi:enoyl-CoA hydratase/carnithine racemase